MGHIKKLKAQYAYFLPIVVQIKDIVCLKKSKHRKKNVFQLNYLHLNINTKKALQLCEAFFYYVVPPGLEPGTT